MGQLYRVFTARRDRWMETTHDLWRARGVGGGHGYMHALWHFVLHQMGCARVVEVKPSAGTSSYRPTPMQWRTKGDMGSLCTNKGMGN